MKAPLVILLVCGLAIDGFTQQSLKTFRSPDDLFRFQYPDMLVNCMQTTGGAARSDIQQGNHSTQRVPDSCVSQASLCGRGESNGNILACFAYPKEEFKDKPHFLAAAFFVSEVLLAKTEAECVAGSPDWPVVSSTLTTINGVTFKEFEIEDNWAGGGQSGSVYRIFHQHMCYELGIQIAISRSEYDPGTVKEFTKKDQNQVEGCLGQALRSFVFLR